MNILLENIPTRAFSKPLFLFESWVSVPKYTFSGYNVVQLIRLKYHKEFRNKSSSKENLSNPLLWHSNSAATQQTKFFPFSQGFPKILAKSTTPHRWGNLGSITLFDNIFPSTNH